eukprot:260161_1
MLTTHWFIVDHTGQFVPRNLMVDLEPNVIDNVKNSQYSKILQGFVINHAVVDSGTGSTLGALISQRIAVAYRKKLKLGLEVYPSPTISTCVVEPYNAMLMLTTHCLVDHTGYTEKYHQMII